MTGWAAHERAALIEALTTAGPSAPTLCEGWTALDLLAHVVTRERRPDVGPGLVIPLLAGYTELVRRRAARQSFEALLDQLRQGPPKWTGFALPGVDELVNVAEFFVHTEDVRRGTPGWQPRELPAGLADRLWGQLTRQARFAFRRSPFAVALVRTDLGSGSTGPAATGPAATGPAATGPAGAGPDGTETLLTRGDDRAAARVELRGSAAELLLHTFNRTGATRIEAIGDPGDLARLAAVRLGL